MRLTKRMNKLLLEIQAAFERIEGNSQWDSCELLKYDLEMLKDVLEDLQLQERELAAAKPSRVELSTGRTELSAPKRLQ